MDFNVREEKPPSHAVLDARARRLARASLFEVRTVEFIKSVSNVIRMSQTKRMQMAVEYLRSKTTLNISRPVTKTYFTRQVITGGTPEKPKYKNISYTKISNRSKAGEYPKADTTMLMKSLFTDVQVGLNGIVQGFIGSPLDYAIYLELSLDRSFLRRTLYEEQSKIIAILTGPQ